jgi:PRTRC genetic system protein E
MFQEIAPLLSGRSFTLILTGTPNGNIRVNFIPTAHSKDTEHDKPLLTPLTFTGSAKELDEGFAGAIASYTEAYTSIGDAVAATKKQMADAKAAADAKAKEEADAKKKAKTTTTKPAAPAKAAPASPAAPSLFDTPTTDEPTTDSEDDDNDDAEEVFEP